jgi:isoquinoline 1-oxidoreductase subunit alpha
VQAVGRRIITIEGLPRESTQALRDAWIAEQVPQCGYCQPGQILAAAELLSRVHDPSDADIDGALSANLCRCGTYPRIRRAIHRAARGGA